MTKYYIEDLFNKFDLVFNRYRFPFKDNQPYVIKKLEDDKIIVALNTVGMAKDDIEVDIQGNMLVVTGKANNEDIDFITSFTRRWNLEEWIDMIEEITWNTKNGVTYITIEMKEKEQPKFKVKYEE
jgi:HSP20 family molecular chaperone IbpA